MSGTEDNATRVLLITANIATCFEQPNRMLNTWLHQLLKGVGEDQPGFVALHCQEVGGKNYNKPANTTQEFLSLLLARPELEPYTRSLVYLDEATTAADKFTALGNLYFIHKDAGEVLTWNFKEARYEAVEGRHQHTGCIEDIPTKEKAKFPQEFFPECKWSRKGFMRTRWRVRGTPFDLVNIHLFHDASNFVAMKEFPSVYTLNRRRALNHTLDRLHNDGLENVPFFMFGDFNFRLDTRTVVELLTKDCHAFSPKSAGGSTGEQRNYHRKDSCSGGGYEGGEGSSCDGADEEPELTISKRSFRHSRHQTIFLDGCGEWLRPYDLEPLSFSARLSEMPVTFPPSYPFAEEPDRSTAITSTGTCTTPTTTIDGEKNTVGGARVVGHHYAYTRLPAWCDRILLSQSARRLIGRTEHLGARYQLLGLDTPMGDHKPVSLLVRLSHSADAVPCCSPPATPPCPNFVHDPLSSKRCYTPQHPWCVCQQYATCPTAARLVAGVAGGTALDVGATRDHRKTRHGGGGALGGKQPRTLHEDKKTGKPVKIPRLVQETDKVTKVSGGGGAVPWDARDAEYPGVRKKRLSKSTSGNRTVVADVSDSDDELKVTPNLLAGVDNSDNSGGGVRGDTSLCTTPHNIKNGIPSFDVPIIVTSDSSNTARKYSITEHSSCTDSIDVGAHEGSVTTSDLLAGLEDSTSDTATSHTHRRSLLSVDTCCQNDRLSSSPSCDDGDGERSCMAGCGVQCACSSDEAQSDRRCSNASAVSGGGRGNRGTSAFDQEVVKSTSDDGVDPASETKFPEVFETKFLAHSETKFSASSETKYMAAAETKSLAASETKSIAPSETKSVDLSIMSLDSEVNSLLAGDALSTLLKNRFKKYEKSVFEPNSDIGIDNFSLTSSMRAEYDSTYGDSRLDISMDGLPDTDETTSQRVTEADFDEADTSVHVVHKTNVCESISNILYDKNQFSSPQTYTNQDRKFSEYSLTKSVNSQCFRVDDECVSLTLSADTNELTDDASARDVTFYAPYSDSSHLQPTRGGGGDMYSKLELLRKTKRPSEPQHSMNNLLLSDSSSDVRSLVTRQQSESSLSNAAYSADDNRKAKDLNSEDCASQPYSEDSVTGGSRSCRPNKDVESVSQAYATSEDNASYRSRPRVRDYESVSQTPTYDIADFEDTGSVTNDASKYGTTSAAASGKRSGKAAKHRRGTNAADTSVSVDGHSLVSSTSSTASTTRSPATHSRPLLQL